MAREAGGSSGGIWGFTVIELERFFKLAYEAGAAAEREACAQVCDAADKATHPADLADAIRARGKK